MSVSGAPRDPEVVEAVADPANGEIDRRTKVGAVHLTVRDLDRSLAFYRDALGLTVLDRGGDRIVFGVGSDGTGRELAVLHGHPDATPGQGYSGLYHFALLLPERIDLARWLAHAARERVPMTGFSDHFVSEALYLEDPDGHGIEIYRDRPRADWEGRVAAQMTTLPLDLENLMAELSDPATETFDGMPDGTAMGHIHLRVARVPETVGFYRDVLGFGLMAELGGQAAFFSAGGYHHHIGANSWESAGVGVAPEGAAALRHASVLFPDRAALDATLRRVSRNGSTPEETPDGPMLTDPSGNRLLLAVG
ncbi:MAG: VOC family protein [Solirubrobacterales bacterium]|nr:VOC family protein [Solirubrobacterales bacterium]